MSTRGQTRYFVVVQAELATDGDALLAMLQQHGPGHVCATLYEIEPEVPWRDLFDAAYLSSVGIKLTMTDEAGEYLLRAAPNGDAAADQFYEDVTHLGILEYVAELRREGDPS